MDGFCSEVAKQSLEPISGTTFNCEGILYLPLAKLKWSQNPTAALALHSSAVTILIAEIQSSGIAVKFYNGNAGQPILKFLNGDAPSSNAEQLINALASSINTKVQSFSVDAKPQIFVCTHGQRDACCAKFGYPIYKTLQTSLGSANVYESSHLGGDRFAATALVLPAGDMYGWLRPDNASSVFKKVLAGEIPTRHWRGNIFQSAMYSVVASNVLQHFKNATSFDNLQFTDRTQDDRYHDVEGVIKIQIGKKWLDSRFEILFETTVWNVRTACTHPRNNMVRKHLQAKKILCTLLS